MMNEITLVQLVLSSYQTAYAKFHNTEGHNVIEADGMAKGYASVELSKALGSNGALAEGASKPSCVEKQRDCRLCAGGIPLKKYFDGRMMHFDGLMAWTACTAESRMTQHDRLELINETVSQLHDAHSLSDGIFNTTLVREIITEAIGKGFAAQPAGERDANGGLGTACFHCGRFHNHSQGPHSPDCPVAAQPADGAPQSMYLGKPYWQCPNSEQHGLKYNRGPHATVFYCSECDIPAIWKGQLRPAFLNKKQFCRNIRI